MTTVAAEVAAPPTPVRRSPFAGTAALLRLALRRDRILLPAWIIGLAVMVATSVTATKDLYPSETSRLEAAQAINVTAALVALYGKVYDPTSVGALSLIKLTAFGAAFVGILFVFITVRHSRADEENGRLELVAAGAVGRAAPLTAALLLGGIGSAALGLVAALALVVVGLPAGGAVAFGLGWALSGLVFTAATGVFAQLTVSARAAVGLGVASVGAAYALRAVGDLAAGDPGFLSWLSPIGWSQQLRPFAGDQWAVVALPLIASAALVTLAYRLRSRRDLGSGLLADRPGPARGSLRSPVALAWRLQRGMLAAWVAGGALMGAVLGSVAHDVSGLLGSEEMRRYITALGGEQGLTDAFLAAEIAIFGAIAGGYAVAAASRLRSEETSGHLENVMATASTRVRWATSHLLVALVGTALLLLVAGAAIGLAHGAAVGDTSAQTVRMLGAAAAHVPAAWVMVGAVVLLFGWVPRWVPLAWGLFVAFVVVGEFGTLWNLPGWVMGLSPFTHSPTLPGGPVDMAPLVGLVLVAGALVVLGLVGWRRRDLQP